jgi:Cu2+-exporting ATPase
MKGFWTFGAPAAERTSPPNFQNPARGKDPRDCRHCGAPLIDEASRASGFCCPGCAYVNRLVHEHGFDAFYRLKDAVIAPADSEVFQPRDYSWLEAAQREAEAGTIRPPQLTLDLQGISCVACVWLVERLFEQQAGGRDIMVNAQLGTVRLRWEPGRFSAADFARALQSFGYLVGPPDPRRSDSESRALAKRVGLCAAFAMNVMLFTLPGYFGMERTFPYAGLFGLLSLGFATLSFLVGGSYFLGRAWGAVRLRAMHIDLPIAVGILGAYLGSLYGWLEGRERFMYFDFVAVFILLMLTGRWAQVAAVERNRRRLLSLSPGPRPVRLAGAGGTREVPPESLAVGDAFLVGPGQTVPVEARLGAEASFSLASISGEPEPRLFGVGQRVPAGAVNVGRSDARLEAVQQWRDSLLARLLVAGEQPGRRHAWLERIVRGYLYGIFGFAIAAGAAWWLRTGDGFRAWSVVTAVLVVSCPCAIGLAFPLADEMATTALRRKGVFVKEEDLWGRLAGVRALVFDKTGTLTLETPVLLGADLRALGPAERSALLALVRESQHPVSQCLLENLLAAGPVEPLAGEVAEKVGFGVEMGSWSLGRPGWKGGDGPVFFGQASDADLVRDGRVIARFRFADAARPGARAEIQSLQAGGFSVHILSGDRSEKVLALARELGLPPDRALGGLTPDGKAEWLDRQQIGRALMLGDGANDSLAFDRALCRGTPIIHGGLLEKKADFYYLGRGIGGIRSLFAVNAIRRRTQVAILVFSVLYNLLAVGFAVAGRMSPLVAAVLMPANSLVTLALVTGGMRKAFARDS